ncbi:hypothetical protein HELRODRAFT_183958 [Helobdella robusta]|uniref:Uncharacterized protein n=1 Tax=Helobdella robusta TaxID=6412 RepID=T1FKC7_HELRO|nr:hypothetical protein HELRODRAFT_183958 [Helobdella robusta]ESO09691.1 hypothetical protein HELRODRAFT_183958 [Helobdella robusta]
MQAAAKNPSQRPKSRKRKCSHLPDDHSNCCKSLYTCSSFHAAMENLAKKYSTQHEKLGEGTETTYHMIDEIIKKLETDSIYVYPEHMEIATEGLKVNGNPDGEANIELDIVLNMRINKFTECRFGFVKVGVVLFIFVIVIPLFFIVIENKLTTKLEPKTNNGHIIYIKSSDGRYLCASSLAENFMKKIGNYVGLYERTLCYRKTKIRYNGSVVQMDVKMVVQSL